MSKFEYTMGKELDLKAEQAKTLEKPTIKPKGFLIFLVWVMDLIYGKERTLPKFKVIETLARYPYWAWENCSYHRITKTYTSTKPADKKINELSLRHIEFGREAQDNEQWHLMLIEDIMRQKGIKMGWLKGSLIPFLMACGYYFLTRAMYYIRPQWSFAMNAAFESHAEHQYMLIVSEHPEWENESVDTDYFQYYPRQKSLADLLRRIGLDERDHMFTSLEEYEALTGKSYL